MSGGNPNSPGQAHAERVEQRIHIEPDGTVVARSGKVEYGQGIRTGFARIVAEELRMPIERVRVELGETDRVPWDMGTFGSLSTATDGKSLRAAAAYARALLLDRASAQLGVPAPALQTRDGLVIAPDGHTTSYEELTAADPLTGLVPEGSSRTDAPPGQPAGAAPLRLEALDIVTGRARYPADVRLAGMLRGHVLHPPVPGARLVALDERAARALPGVVAVVRQGDFVGVVAERDEQAVAGAHALEAEWSREAVIPAQPIDAVLRRDEAVEAAFNAGALRLEARFHVPHIAHASICPSAAVADVQEDRAELYVAIQRPFALREEAAELLGVAPERVHVHPQMMSGMYGRGNVGDAALEAVRLSRAVKRPVLVQWTRAEEFRLSPQRPVLDVQVQAALDTSGAIIGWRYSSRTNPHTYGAGAGLPHLTEITSGRNAVPAYRLGRAEILLHVAPAAVRTGAFRSLAAAPNVFAIESFMDELSHASKQDPIAFRLRCIDDARLSRVLKSVRERSNWDRRPREPGRGFGVACAVYNGTYVAEVAEVTVAQSGQASLRRVWCAVDPGRLVHPDGARNQIEGGVQQAASWTLLEELRHHDGEVTSTSWRDYPIATFHDAPEDIDVVFTCEPGIGSTGIGEPGSVPTAAAIANAVFEACGARVRQLPLSAAAIAATRP
jgi:nicotinate dehydrogenase subunit B